MSADAGPGVPTLNGVHRQLRKERGHANQHPCVDCGREALDWSYQGNDENEIVEEVTYRCKEPSGDYYQHVMQRPYSSDLEQYVPRCRSCHRKYDLGWRDGICPRGHDTAVTGMSEGETRNQTGKSYTRKTCAECKREAARRRADAERERRRAKRRAIMEASGHPVFGAGAASSACAGPDCDREAVTRGMCGGHYSQLRRGVELTPLRPRNAVRGECQFPACGRPQVSRGLCQSHKYQRATGQELRPINAERVKRVDACEVPLRGGGACGRPTTSEASRVCAEHRANLRTIGVFA